MPKIEREIDHDTDTKRQRFLANMRTEIAAGKFQIIAVPDARYPFAYTVGLEPLFSFPEILVLGLNHSTAHAILNTIADRIRDHTVSADMTEIIANFPVKLRAVDQSAARSYMGIAVSLYGDAFPVLQLLWPDAQGRFLSDPNMDATMKKMQTVTNQNDR